MAGMLRVTLKEDYGKRLELQYGFEDVVPLYFGPQADDVTVDMSVKNPAPMPARKRIFILDYANKDERSCLMPQEVVALYFGDWRAGTDPVAVSNRRQPSFGVERERVAKVWGDYYYSDKHGLYATVKIGLPRMPDVEIAAVNANGANVGEWRYHPLKHWKFEELLDENAAAEMAEILARRGRRSGVAPDLSQMSPDQIRQLAEALKPHLESPAAVAK